MMNEEKREAHPHSIIYINTFKKYKNILFLKKKHVKTKFLRFFKIFREGTIVVTKVDEPSKYGVVVYDQVSKFLPFFQYGFQTD